jgi:hypothetical protein
VTTTAPEQPGQAYPLEAYQGPSADELAVYVASVLATAASPEAAVLLLAGKFTKIGVETAALLAVLHLVMDRPHEPRLGYGPATNRVEALNLMRRAQYLVHAARRMSDAWKLARARNEDPVAALKAALDTERRYFGQHILALESRMAAASRVDSASMMWGPLLGWYARMDARTSAACRYANGHNFRADRMPAIGYPGMVHPVCRCLPGPPIPGASMLAGSGKLVFWPRKAEGKPLTRAQSRQRLAVRIAAARAKQ